MGKYLLILVLGFDKYAQSAFLLRRNKINHDLQNEWAQLWNTIRLNYYEINQISWNFGTLTSFSLAAFQSLITQRIVAFVVHL